MTSISINIDESPSVSSNYSISDSSSEKRYKKYKLFRRVVNDGIKHFGDAFENVLTHFPLQKYVLRNEIPKDKLTKSLCENPSPGVLELLFDMKFRIDWDKLAKHPDAFTKKYQLENIIKSGVSPKFWLSLCENTNPYVIKFIIKKIMEVREKKNKIEEYIISLAKNPNPEAIKFVSEHEIIQNLRDIVSTGKGTRSKIMATPFQEKLFKSLVENPTRDAMKLMVSIWIQQLKLLDTNGRVNYQYISFVLSEDIRKKLFENPAAMKYIRKILPLDVDLYSTLLQGNPNPKAFELLGKNTEYNYYTLSENPSSKAIKILTKRMEEEKSISKVEYYNLRNKNGPGIFLNWISISKNPKARSLILAKIEEERGREEEIAEDRRNRYPERNLNWDYVSANPAIFKRIIKMTEEKEEEKAKKIELYLHPNTEVDKNLKLKSELKQKIGEVFSSDITDKIISILNIGSVDELISINPLIFSIKLFKIFPEKNEQGNSQRQKLKELITNLKTNFKTHIEFV